MIPEPEPPPAPAREGEEEAAEEEAREGGGAGRHSCIMLVNRIGLKAGGGGAQQGIGRPSVYHAVVVIFLEFFAWGLLTTPMLTVLHETFSHHTFLMNGLIQGVKGFFSFLSAPLIGALSDAWGRKYFLLITVFFTCAPIPLMRISPWWYFAMISVSGIFSVTFSVIFAYVADVTQEHERITAYGLVSATFAASLVTSPAIGAYLSASYGDNLVVLVATLVAVVDICFILLAVPESLPEKIRPASWGASISWEQADPFASLKKVRKDSTVLLICITVFLSYLPEAGQYSSFFLYLRQIIGFGSASIAAFIAVVGILSIIAQWSSSDCSWLYQEGLQSPCSSPKGLRSADCVSWYLDEVYREQKYSSSWPWLSNPSVGLVWFWISVLDDVGSRRCSSNVKHYIPGSWRSDFTKCRVRPTSELPPDQTSGKKAMQDPSDERAIIPGPPFLVGACIVLLAFLVALFIPEHSKTSSTRKHSSSSSNTLVNNLDRSSEEDIEPLLQDSSV
ncbi:hippocampus abundant transcript-like protein 1 isoform X2 [Strigops habroptila]|uniref:hippocampus abundant transcript-like protein 1 isoform X2 n=1 Tax=Strigops habroptila TaxID=2489341 RepID=UPI0011CF574A|nr:hippocampus abundant transcript-like protein 1 isoform X2 [Strigops habroptila]